MEIGGEGKEETKGDDIMSSMDVLPADCLSIQEIGSVAGVFMVVAWVLLLITGLFMAFKASQVDHASKPFYYLNSFICAVAVFSYFGMFSGMGWQTITGCRQFFYIRYIDWAVTTALTILALGLLAGQDTATIAAVMGADLGMIISGYVLPPSLPCLADPPAPAPPPHHPPHESSLLSRLLSCSLPLARTLRDAFPNTTLHVLDSLSLSQCATRYLGAVALVGVVKWLWFIVGLVLFLLVLVGIVREFRQTGKPFRSPFAGLAASLSHADT